MPEGLTERDLISLRSTAGAVFSCDAKYLPHVRASIALAIAECGEDVKRRELGLPSRIHDTMIDQKAEGRIVVVLGAESCTPEPF